MRFDRESDPIKLLCWFGHWLWVLVPERSRAGDVQAVSERQLAPEQPASRTQLIVCSFLAGALLMAVAADASTSTPSWPQVPLCLDTTTVQCAHEYIAFLT